MLDPVIKVRHKLALLLALASLVVVAESQRCDKTPLEEYGTEKTPGSNGFELHIVGSPRMYRAGQMYTISLSGVQEDQVAKFQGFMLVAEHQQVSHNGDPARSLGVFNLKQGDAMTKFSHRCSHAVEATSSISKESVEVLWTAPERGSGCIAFHAMVVERSEIWYSDDGALTYVLCEDNSPLAEPQPVEDCCACNEAKYEMIFEGIWSRHTHPKDFPRDEWQTKFSKIIGASHHKEYTLWEYGRESSPALDALGRFGMTDRLEAQMKAYSQNIRSVIKAHGLQQRSNVAGQTFAVFRVDKSHHLLSFVSKMIPSPDWVVGVSKENLCMANCTWAENRVIDLYPWDLGIESGMRYDSNRMTTFPKQGIHRITSSNPDDINSPFFDETSAPMKPAARLHIIKQREYLPACPKAVEPASNGEGDGISWNPPEPDSFIYNGVGVGQQYPTGEDGMNSPYGGNPYGQGGQGSDSEGGSYQYDQDNQDSYDSGNSDYGGGGYGGYGGYGGGGYGGGGGGNDACSTTDWGPWSECSSNCGTGSRSRQRQYLNPDLARMNMCPESLFEKQVCPHLPRCPPKRYEGTFNPFPADDMAGYSTPWSARGLESDGLRAEKDPGSQSYFYETTKNEKNTNVPRYPTSGGYHQDSSTSSNWDSAGQNDQGPFGNSYIYGGMTADGQPDLPTHSSYTAPAQEDQVDCSLSEWGDWSDCSSGCNQRGFRTRTRMYMSPDQSSTCSEDLMDQQECQGECAGVDSRRTSSMGFGSYGGGNNNNRRNQHHRRFEAEDPECAVSKWSKWSPCSNPCGPGQKRRTRLYKKPFVENRSCPIKLFDKESCYGQDTSQCGNYYNDYGVSGSPTYDDDQQTYSNFDDDYDIVSDVGNGIAIQTLDDDNNEILEATEEPQTEEPFAAFAADEDDAEEDEEENDICMLEKDPGPCKGYSQRWYYDKDAESCTQFSYFGCLGNKNNFASREKCEARCGGGESDLASYSWGGQESGASLTTADNDHANIKWVEGVNDWSELDRFREPSRIHDMDSLSLVRITQPEENRFRPVRRGSAPPKVDCQVTAWSQWTECSVSCGVGWTTRKRSVLVNPGNGGKTCPKKMDRKKKCRQMPCPANTKYWYQGNWRHLTYDD